jgi:hypothetical protein
VKPNDLANYIRGLMVSYDLMPNIDPEAHSIQLKLELMEEVPEYLFLNMRFELLVPIQNLDEVKDLSKRLELIRTDRHYSKINFSVDEVKSENDEKPCYTLLLTPTEDDQSFQSLIHQMSQAGHPYKAGEGLEWRNGFNLMRFYHAQNKGTRDRAHIVNPLYVPTTPTRLSKNVLSRLPVDRSRSNDAMSDSDEIEALLASADDAFSDPGERPRRETFGYETYQVNRLNFLGLNDLDHDEALRQSA